MCLVGCIYVCIWKVCSEFVYMRVMEMCVCVRRKDGMKKRGKLFL